MSKILVITSKLPYPATGADEADRFEGIRLLTEAGHSVSVIAKTATYQKTEDAVKMSEILRVPVQTVPYGARDFSFERFFDWKYLDGAANEYTDPKLADLVEREIASFKPDIVWLDGSFMWHLIALVHKHKLPAVVRSLQIESTHVFADEGWSILNVVRAFVKDLGEEHMAKNADFVVAINRNEADIYRKMGAKKVETVPLRQLPSLLEKESAVYRDIRPLHIQFAASTFSVTHNLEGALKVIHQIAPALEKAAPGEFVIHVTGGKLPERIAANLPANVVYEGYVADYDAFMKGIDIALTESLGIVGMHGKLFAPVAAGIPTVTQSFALAGFPFKGGEHLLSGETVGEVVKELLLLRDVRYREKIGRAGRALSEELFSRNVLIQTLRNILNSL